MDIYEVNLTKLATQFIEYIDLMREFDLEVAGEFLVMASTLMYIKSRELLPVDQQAQSSKARTKAKIRAGNSSGSSSNTKNSRTPPRNCRRSKRARKMSFRACREKLNLQSEAAPVKPEVSIFDLLNAVNAVLQRFKKREGDAREIFEDKWTVSEKIEFVLKMITERGSVRFAELFENAANRAEVVCTFLALLELIRLKQLVCTQPEPFAEIEISRAGQVVESVANFASD